MNSHSIIYNNYIYIIINLTFWFVVSACSSDSEHHSPWECLWISWGLHLQYHRVGYFPHLLIMTFFCCHSMHWYLLRKVELFIFCSSMSIFYLSMILWSISNNLIYWSTLFMHFPSTKKSIRFWNHHPDFCWCPGCKEQ